MLQKNEDYEEILQVLRHGAAPPASLPPASCA